MRMTLPTHRPTLPANTEPAWQRTEILFCAVNSMM